MIRLRSYVFAAKFGQLCSNTLFLIRWKFFAFFRLVSFSGCQWGALVSSGLVFVVLFQPQPQFARIPVITFLADWFEVDLVELGFDGHLLVAGGAGEVVDTPSFIESREDIALDDLVANVAKVAEELVVVGLTVSQTLSLVMSIAKEGFLTLGTNEVLDMPMLAECSDNPLFDGSPAGAANGYSHLVMAPQAIQLIQLIGRVARPRPDLPGRRGQLGAAGRTVVMVRMVNLTTESQRLAVDYGMALLAHVLAHALGLHLRVALVTEGSSLIFDESEIGQLLVTHLAGEALRVPGGHHGLDDTSNDELAAFSAAWREENVKIVFAIFSAFEFVEDAVRKWTEALGTHEALRMIEFSVGVDDLGLGLEPVVAPGTAHTIHVHDARKR